MSKVILLPEVGRLRFEIILTDQLMQHHPAMGITQFQCDMTGVDGASDTNKAKIMFKDGGVDPPSNA